MAQKYSIANVNHNAYAIMGAVIQIMSEAAGAMGWDRETLKKEKDAYLEEAMSGDYDNLVHVSKDKVELINKHIADSESQREK